MKSIFALTIFMTCCVVISGCVMFQEKGESEKGSETISGGGIRNLLPGTWKLTSIHCDSSGNNCERYQASRYFTYSKNGELFVNDVKRGTYRLSGNTCTLDTGKTRYTVKIVFINSIKLITGESNRETTELFMRMP